VTGADDPEAAFAGLEAARARLAPLGPALLSPVVRSPVGPLLRVADLPGDDDELQAVPDLVASALAEAGVVDAVVEVVEPVGPLDQLDRTDGAVVLRVFPVPAGPAGALPASWLEVASEWVLGDLGPSDQVQLRLLGAPFTVRAADASASLYAAATARAWCDLVQGDLRRRIRSASLTFGHAPHLALAAGGPACDAPALLARYDVLCDLARDLSEGVAYACVDLEPSFELLGLGLAGAGWPEHGGAAPNAVASLAGDVVVPDAYPFQVLGPGHADRLARAGRSGPLGQPLPDGRYALELGDPIDWLPEHETRDEALEQATKALEGLLVTDAELAELSAARPLRPPLPAHAPTPRGGLDLDDITLEALPHARRGLHLTLLELVSWLAHEHHSDAPVSVSPVLASYARWLASGLDHEQRQRLKPYAPRLVGTRTPGLPRGPWRPIAPVDEERAWLAADRLACGHAATWLRAAGVDDVARRLQRVRPRPDRGHLPGLLALLDEGLAALLRQTDVDPADEAAWEAWERASEETGWVAASEAAWVGIPDGLASSTELRVVELVRDPRAAEAVLEGRTTVSTAVREAGLRAVAEAAWRGAGRAAAQAVDAMVDDPDSPAELVVVSLDTARERAAQGAAAQLGLDRDALELALEQADQAAREALAPLVDDAGASAGALDAARAAAAASLGGAAWREVERMTSEVYGEAAWTSVRSAAQTAAARVLRHARPLLDRATLVAVAREASGLAARLTAARGAAAVEPVVADLGPPALGLLDDLLDLR
jgi:hypothetical protein